MGNSFNAEQFHLHCLKSSLYIELLLYAYSTLSALIGIELMRRTQGWNNTALLLLLLGILVFSVASFLITFGVLQKYRYPAIAVALA